MVPDGATKKDVIRIDKMVPKRHGGARERQIKHGMTVAPEEND
jgi:hypothetical protein